MENTKLKINEALIYIMNKFKISKLNSLEFEFSNIGTDVIINSKYRSYIVDTYNVNEQEYLNKNKINIINGF